VKVRARPRAAIIVEPAKRRRTAMRSKNQSKAVFAAALLAIGLAAYGQSSPGHPQVRVTTNVGSFVIELDAVRAPLTVEAFLGYVDEGFYSNTLVHRVAAGFVVQGGGYTPDFEEKPTRDAVFNESGNGLTNLRGTVGLARSNDPHTGTSQFYINLVDNADLNPRPTRWGYAVFGTVVAGMETIDTIGDVATGAGGPFDRHVPVRPIVIESVERLP
jgi:cyclophilin family peptidyl-prolyl cis-trans isomerase